MASQVDEQRPASREAEASHPSGEPAGDIQMFNALSSHSRAEILRALAGRPKGVPELVRELRLPRVTLRYHLAVLLGQGLVEEVRSEGARRVGRPPKLYRARQRAAVSGFPKRRYDLLGELTLDALVRAVGEEKATAVLRQQGREIGESLIRDLGARANVDRWTPETFERVVVDGYYRREGASDIVSRGKDEITFRSYYCPFLELAEKRPCLICDALDIGVHNGMDKALGAKTERVTCMAHGAMYCEYRVQWPRRDRAQAAGRKRASA